MCSIILFATAVIFAAQLTTNMAANVVSPSNDFSNLNPRLISYVTGGLITAVIGILMMPWKLMASMGAYIFTWLIGYSGLMGAIAGILICDYWVIRKQRLDLAGLFDPNGPYSYGSGFNWRAIVALCYRDRSGCPRISPSSNNAGRSGQRSKLLRQPVHLRMVRYFCPRIRHILRFDEDLEGRVSLMPRTVKCALIQCSNAAATDLPIEEIKRLNIEKHLTYIEEAANRVCR